MTKGKAPWLLFAAILFAGCATRIIYISEISREPEFAFPQVDASFNDYWAKALVTGDWSPPPDREDPLIPSSPYFRPPGYSFFLAAVYRLFGLDPVWPRILQACLGLVSCLLAFLLAKRRFGSGPALICAALMNLYWPFIYFEGELLEPALLVFLGVTLVMILDRWTEGITIRSSVAAGILIGAIALVRPTILLFGAAVPVWAWWLESSRRVGKRHWFRMITIYVLSAFAIIATATIRNYAVSDELFIISSNAGINLFIGNNEDATGLVAREIPGLGSFGTCFDYPGVVRNLSKKAGRSLSHREVSNYFRQEAGRFVTEHPGRALSLAAKKFLLFWGPLEVSHNKENEIERDRSHVLRLLPVNFSFALTSFILGVLVFLLNQSNVGNGDRSKVSPQAQLAIILSMYILFTFFAHLPFFIAGRYRIPIVPHLLIVGSYGIWKIAEKLAQRRLSRVALWTGVGLLSYAVLSRNPTGYSPNYGRWWFARGIALSHVGDTEGARNAYEEALRIRPDFYYSHTNLGVILMNMGDLDGAKMHLREAVNANPHDPAPHFNLGLVFSRQGNSEAAKEKYSRVLTINPQIAEAHYQMGVELERGGNISEAFSHYGQAAWIRRDAKAMLKLGAFMQLEGYIEKANNFYKRAMEIEPDIARLPVHPVR